MYEVEIKSLLGSEERAEHLRERMEEHDLPLQFHGAHAQRNHYFVAPDNPSRIVEQVAPLLTAAEQDELKEILAVGEDLSIRSREADGTVLLVVKASIDEGTSANTVSRREFEAEVDCSLDELDERLLAAGLEYQSKWSRDREEYTLGDITVTIDRNAGYGYLAEFEQVVQDESRTADVRDKLLALMDELGVEELPQERLERMFEYYNNNWEDYYGTDKTFTVE